MTHDENTFLRKKFSVFIVDDDESYLSALGFRLMKDNRKHEYSVYCYTSGEECINNLDLSPVVIILDYYLNAGDPLAMSGLKVLRRIKELKPDIPVVVLSAQHSVNVALDTLHEGAYTYVIKDRHALFTIEKIIENIAAPDHESMVH